MNGLKFDLKTPSTYIIYVFKLTYAFISEKNMIPDKLQRDSKSYLKKFESDFFPDSRYLGLKILLK